MPYRTIFIIAAATILGMACVTSDALAFRGGARAGGFHAGAGGVRGAHVGGAYRGGAYRGGVNRGGAYGAYRGYRPGVAAGVGAAAVGAAAGAAAVGPYYNSACGSYPYPACQ